MNKPGVPDAAATRGFQYFFFNAIPDTMSDYTPPSEEAAQKLANKLTWQPAYLQQLLPAFFAGEKGAERLLVEARKLLAEHWPAQKKEREKRQAELEEKEREQAEIKANENCTEPVFILLPKPGAAVAQPANQSEPEIGA